MKFITFARRFSISAATSAMMAVAIAGCSSSSEVKAPPPPKEQPNSSAATAGAKGATALESFRSDLVASQGQIDSVLAALAELNNPATTDLRTSFNKYTDQVARMKQHEDTMKREAEAMRAQRSEYFAAWEAKMSEIDNPTIRASAESRRRMLRDNQEKVATTSAAARDAYIPFMKDLQDVRTYLEQDLSRSSIADIGDAVKKVNADGQGVRGKIGEVIVVLDKIQAGG